MHTIVSHDHALHPLNACMQCNGKEISWSHLLSLYHSDAGADREAPGVTIVGKLKREHLYLTSFSKMLAAQVSSCYSVHITILHNT